MKFDKFWPLLLIFLTCLVFFYPTLTRGLLPIPNDFPLGVYYPWLDFSWGGYTQVPVKNPLLADVPSLIYPLKVYAMNILTQGSIPLWNPLMFGGYPLMANFQSSVFYPLNFVYLFFDSLTAWSIQVILQPILASCFMYFLLRHLKLSKIASCFGGIAFAFSGFNLIWLEYNIHAHVSAFIPLILLFLDKLILEKKVKYGVFYSLVLSLQIIAGYPQTSLYTLLIVALWVFFRFGKKLLKKENVITILKIAFFTIVGLGISAIQLIPGFEMISFSQRVSEGLDPSLKYLPIRQLIGLYAPDYFGNPTTLNYFGPPDYTNNTGFMGIVAITLASLALINFKNGLVKLLFLIYIGSLILVVNNPIADFFHSHLLPGVSAAKATRMLIVANFALSFLAAVGIDTLRQEYNFKKIVRSLYLPLILISGTVLGTVVAKEFVSAYQDQLILKEVDASFLSETVNNLNISFRNLILPSVLLIFSFIAIFLYRKIKLVSLGLLYLLIVFELFRFGWKYNPFTPREFNFPTTPVLEYLQNQKPPFRMNGGDVLPIAMWIPYNLESMAGYDAVYPERVARLISVLNTNDPKAGPAGRYGNIQEYHTRLFDLTNTEFILAMKLSAIGRPDYQGKPAGKLSSGKFETVFEDRSVTVLRNRDNLPRAFFITDWDIETDEDKIISSLFTEDYPVDKKIIIEKDFTQFSQAADNKASVEYLSYLPKSSLIKVESERNGFLFISDTFFLCWKAKVDGIEMEILRANFTFRAIPIQAGTHQVEMFYDPSSFKYGIFISLLSLITLLAALILGKILVVRRNL